MNHTLGNSICLVIDRKYKANKKQICKGLSKVYTSNKKCYESGDSYIAKLLCLCNKQLFVLTENNKARKRNKLKRLD